MATQPRARRNAERFFISQQFVAQAFGTITASSETASGTSPCVIGLPQINAGDQVLAITPSANTVGIIYKGVITAGKLNVYALNVTTGNVAIASTVTLSVEVAKNF